MIYSNKLNRNGPKIADKESGRESEGTNGSFGGFCGCLVAIIAGLGLLYLIGAGDCARMACSAYLDSSSYSQNTVENNTLFNTNNPKDITNLLK
ncbi:MAG: hypothetical protein KKA64_03125 [Nanoarchaeota archaeon]|nr:hypothetical protein [Nanoarchaeota archaeon]